jgi:hypothetical protein
MGDGGLHNPNKIGAFFSPTSREYSKPFPNWNKGFDHLLDPGNEIIMAHYAIEKPSHVNLGLIEYIRKRAIQYVQRCKQAILIGIHLEEQLEADPYLFKILNTLRKCNVPVTYVGIAGKEAEEARNKYKFDVLTKGFAGFLGNLL